jgi:hypothetical protein
MNFVKLVAVVYCNAPLKHFNDGGTYRCRNRDVFAGKKNVFNLGKREGSVWVLVLFVTVEAAIVVMVFAVDMVSLRLDVVVMRKYRMHKYYAKSE